MKKLKLLILMLAAPMLWSCSADDPMPPQSETSEVETTIARLHEDGEKNIGFMKALSAGDEAVTFAMVENRVFEQSEDSPDKWIEWGDDILGYYPPAPKKITIYDGKTWEGINLFRMPGINPLAYPMAAYKKATGFNKTYLVSCGFEYSENCDSVRISGKEFRLHSMTPEGMAISYMDDVCRTSSGIGEDMVVTTIPIFEWMRYEKSELAVPDVSNSLFFDTELDAYLNMIELLRDEFGDVFHINGYLAPEVELDDDLVNLDEIRKYILERYGSH